MQWGPDQSTDALPRLRSVNVCEIRQTSGKAVSRLVLPHVIWRKKYLADLDQHQALLIGAGETGQLVARHLIERGCGRIDNRQPHIQPGRRNSPRFSMRKRFLLTNSMTNSLTSILLLPLQRPKIMFWRANKWKKVIANRTKPLICIDLGSAQGYRSTSWRLGGDLTTQYRRFAGSGGNEPSAQA